MIEKVDWPRVLITFCFEICYFLLSQFEICSMNVTFWLRFNQIARKCFRFGDFFCQLLFQFRKVLHQLREIVIGATRLLQFQSFQLKPNENASKTLNKILAKALACNCIPTLQFRAHMLHSCLLTVIGFWKCNLSLLPTAVLMTQSHVDVLLLADSIVPNPTTKKTLFSWPISTHLLPSILGSA